MPSVSAKQARFMSAAAHNPDFAARADIPVSVAREFHAADAGKSYGAGGHATPHVKAPHAPTLAHRRVAAALRKR